MQVFWLIIDLATQWVRRLSVTLSHQIVARSASLTVCRAAQCGYVAAYLLRTEKFFDLLGSLGFLSIALCSLVYGDFYHARQVSVHLSVRTAQWRRSPSHEPERDAPAVLA